jgi:hypothetical protein
VTTEYVKWNDPSRAKERYTYTLTPAQKARKAALAKARGPEYRSRPEAIASQRTRKQSLAYREKAKIAAALRREKRMATPEYQAAQAKKEELRSAIEKQKADRALVQAERKALREFNTNSGGHKQMVREYIYSAKECCSRCPETTPICLDLHHVDPSTKKFTLSGKAHNHSMEAIKAEIAKCIVLCANCHRKEHARIAEGREQIYLNMYTPRDPQPEACEQGHKNFYLMPSGKWRCRTCANDKRRGARKANNPGLLTVARDASVTCYKNHYNPHIDSKGRAKCQTCKREQVQRRSAKKRSSKASPEASPGRLTKLGTCSFCHEPFLGQSNKKFCSKKCYNLDYYRQTRD